MTHKSASSGIVDCILRLQQEMADAGMDQPVALVLRNRRELDWLALLFRGEGVVPIQQPSGTHICGLEIRYDGGGR